MNIRDNWIAEILPMLGDHPFARSDEAQTPSPAIVLLKAIHRLHFEDPSYSCIEPPLPGLAAPPLDDSWVEPSLHQEDLGGATRRLDGNERDLTPTPGVTIRDILRSENNVLILGDPGSGKSTILKWAARYTIRASDYCLAIMVPLFIPFDRFITWKLKNPKRSIYHFFCQVMVGLPRDLADQFHHFMEDAQLGTYSQRRFFRIFLDGPNELCDSTRADFRATLRRVRALSPVVFTTRPANYYGPLPGWSRYRVAPLSLQRMRALMHDRFNETRESDPELLLCRKLDTFTELRELASNPFYLVQLCTCQAATSSELPSHRTDLFRLLLQRVADFYNSGHENDGYPISSAIRVLSEDVAYGLLSRASPSPYQFCDTDINVLAKDQGELAATWRQARLIRLANEYEGSYAFVHSSLHQYLAAQAIVRRLVDGAISLDSIGLDPKWFTTLRFVFGSLTSATIPPQTREWITEHCRTQDRFGIIATILAHFLAEIPGGSPHTWGGESDLRPILWNGVVASADPTPYVRALVALDADYAITRALQFEWHSSDSMDRLYLLQDYIPRDQSRRPLLQNFSHNLVLHPPLEATESLSTGYFVYTASYLLDDDPQQSTLSNIDALHSTSELLNLLSSTAYHKIRRHLLLALAMERTAGAEEYIIRQYHSAQTSEDIVTHLLALKTLGTPTAYDAILDSLHRLATDEALLSVALEKLKGVPTKQNAARVLEFAEPRWPQQLRIYAIRALARCSVPVILDKLAKYGAVAEPDVDVRVAVLQTLGRARNLGICRFLQEDECARRGDPREQEALWYYFADIATPMNALPQATQWFNVVESIFLHQFGCDQPPAPTMVLVADLYRRSQSIKAILNNLAFDLRLPPETRAAAISCLRPEGNETVLQNVKEVLVKCLAEQPMIGRVACACAGVLASAAPEQLLNVKHPIIDSALWAMSLATGLLVFSDRVVNSASTVNSDADVGPGKISVRSDALRTDILEHDPDYMVRQTARKRKSGERRQQQELASDYLDVARLMFWLKEHYGDPDGPRFLLDEKRLTDVWEESSVCPLSQSRSYRLAAVFCQLMGKSFRIDKSEWDYECGLLITESRRQSARRSLERILTLGIRYIKRWSSLTKLLHADELPDEVGSVRISYSRAIEKIDGAGPRRSIVSQHDVGKRQSKD